MGYTHYWKQKRDFSVADWQQIIVDIKTICNHAQHIEGIALANGMGEGGTSPELSDDAIIFNGVGDDGHEGFYIPRKRVLEKWESKDELGGGFCKTARKPYDTVVTACLAYLSTVTRKEDPATHEPIIGSEALRVRSDGNGSNFIAGVDLARAALPRIANLIDIPMGVMQDDRWCAPWVDYDRTLPFEIHFCIDGHGYVLMPKSGESHRFETHADLARWLESTKQAVFSRGGRTSWGAYSAIEPNIWNAYGSFDKARHDRLRKAQMRKLKGLFPVPPEHAHQPPAYVRPGEMPENAGREFCYSVTALMNLLEGKRAA